MSKQEKLNTPQVGGSELNVQLCVGSILICKFCGSKRMYQAFKILGCLDCCNAYSIDDA
jgi:hypothetical protein